MERRHFYRQTPERIYSNPRRTLDVPDVKGYNARVVLVRGKTAKDALIINSAADVYNVLCDYRYLNQEGFYVISLSARHRVLCLTEVTIGGGNSTCVEPRDVFIPVLLSGGTTLIIAHNHPSGDITPSDDDIALTKRCREAGKLLGLPLLDHVIFGDENFISLAERGLV